MGVLFDYFSAASDEEAAHRSLSSSADTEYPYN
ncbi:hypothetical protein J3D46_001582 [Paenarthrobacter sp. A20]|nr:hypothetical protein [Paenarthrobacter sp. A20]